MVSSTPTFVLSCVQNLTGNPYDEVVLLDIGLLLVLEEGNHLFVVVTGQFDGRLVIPQTPKTLRHLFNVAIVTSNTTTNIGCAGGSSFTLSLPMWNGGVFQHIHLQGNRCERMKFKITSKGALTFQKRSFTPSKGGDHGGGALLTPRHKCPMIF